MRTRVVSQLLEIPVNVVIAIPNEATIVDDVAETEEEVGSHTAPLRMFR